MCKKYNRGGRRGDVAANVFYALEEKNPHRAALSQFSCVCATPLRCYGMMLLANPIRNFNSKPNCPYAERASHHLTQRVTLYGIHSLHRPRKPKKRSGCKRFSDVPQPHRLRVPAASHISPRETIAISRNKRSIRRDGALTFL
jgi:hypothetical protein